MSVTKQRQAIGRWDLTLSDATPTEATDLLDIERTTAGFGHLVITPAPVDTTAIDVADLLDMSIYTGVCFTRENRYRYSGNHASVWLGDPDGKADLNESLVGGGGPLDFDDWVAAIIPDQLTTGTVTNPSAATRSYLYRWDKDDSSPRMALDAISDIFGTEWEVTDALALNAATAAVIYGSTPTAIVSPWWQGRDDTYTALRATIGYTVDLEDYSTRILNLYNSGGSGIGSSGSTTYLDGFGNTLAWKRRIESPDVTDATTAQAISDAALTRFNKVRQSGSIRTDSPAVMADVRCGSTIYAYNPDVDLYDGSNQVTYQGQTVLPVSLRVEQVDMPITADLGVYFLCGDQTVVDLNRWVVRESAGASLTVGAPQRRLTPSVHRLLRREGR